MITKRLLLPAFFAFYVLIVMTSCNNSLVDVKVNKSKIKSETVDYLIVPPSALRPVINKEEVDILTEKLATKIINYAK